MNVLIDSTYLMNGVDRLLLYLKGAATLARL